MKNYISILAFLTIGVSSVFGQTQKAFLKAADEAFANKNYYGALTWYQEALEFDEGNPDIIYKIAQSAREFEAYDVAASKYKVIVDSLGEDNFPDAAFYLGQM